MDGKGAIDASQSFPVERIAPGIIPRKSVDQPLQTGIMAVDSNGSNWQRSKENL